MSGTATAENANKTAEAPQDFAAIHAAQGEETPQDFAAWIAAQGEETQALYNDHIGGLKSALKSERDERKGLAKQVADLAKQAEAGSDAQKQLEAFGKQLEAADRRTAAYEQLHQAGVSNLKAALTLAEADEMFDRRGNVQIKELKEAYPELFRAAPTTNGNAGSGTGAGQPKGGTMNDFIRGYVAR